MVSARQLQGSSKYFLDADIEECFDNIDHHYLLNRFNCLRMFRKQIQAWLKAGIMNFHRDTSSGVNPKGTFQGNVIFLLLMNIAFHGMENYVVKEFVKNKVKAIWYANNFVSFGKIFNNVQKAKKLVVEFLKPVGLKLAEEKTRIGYSMKIKPGTTGLIGLNFFSYHFQNIGE